MTLGIIKSKGSTDTLTSLNPIEEGVIRSINRKWFLLD